MENLDHLILANKLIVPTHLCPMNALFDFNATIRNRDQEDINLTFYEHDMVKGLTYFQRGNMRLINKYFGKFYIEDIRSTEKMKQEITFTEKLYPNQQKVVDIVLQSDGSGIIEAPPRFGKTVVMTYITCQLGFKTLFLSHQIDLAKQAIKTFWKMTNILEIEEQTGRTIAGIVNKWDDLEKYDICFMTYQKFISNEKSFAMLEKYKSAFGLVFVDEAHRMNAPRYSEVVSTFNSRWRMGVSATPKIKSKMDIKSKYILGPVIAYGEADQVPGRVKIVNTGIQIPFKCGNIRTFFPLMLDFLEHHTQRNDFIVDYIAAYADAGHYCMAVSERVRMLNYITNALQKRGYRAVAYHHQAAGSKKQREEILQKARSGEIQILIANRSMVLGLDIPRLTTFFNLTPSANQPNYYQEMSRVRTPFQNKLMSYVVDFVDFHQICFGCLKSRKKVYERENFEIEE